MDDVPWVSLPVVDAGAGNLVPDPSFETGVADWTSVSSATISQSDDRPRSGQHCLRASGRRAAYDGPGLDLTELVQPGVSYAVSLWLRNVTEPARQNLTLRYACPGASPVYTQIHASQVPLDWVQFSARFVGPPCPDPPEVFLFVESDQSGTYGDLDLDDVAILPEGE